jgi:hypothetical protein
VTANSSAHAYGKLEAGIDDDRVWMACECGAVLAWIDDEESG